MDKNPLPIADYLKSGEYYKDARKWYVNKYTDPFSERTYLFCVNAVILLLLCTLLLNIRTLLPIVNTVRYTLHSTSNVNSVTILKANQIKNNPLLSIADILLRGYIVNREKYNYANLDKQFLYVQNNSTRIVFKQYHDYMSIDNPISPILRYQQAVKREVSIISTTYPTATSAIVRFSSLATTSTGQIFENIEWQAIVSFDIDPISAQDIDGTKYNFFVTDYKLNLIQDKMKK